VSLLDDMYARRRRIRVQSGVPVLALVASGPLDHDMLLERA